MAENTDIVAFGPLPIRRRKLAYEGGNRYRVISSSGEAKQIEAATAYEAFKRSGFGSAVKIERVSSLTNNIIDNSLLKDNGLFNPDAEFADVTPAKQNPLAQFKLRKNPLVSADELDELMRALQALAPSAPADTAADVTTTAASETPSGIKETPGPAGMEVHGDGFDEIIPGAVPVKPVHARPAEEHLSPPATIAADEAPAASVPAKELSPADVDRLLGGKES
jgi:hypothetical protein